MARPSAKGAVACKGRQRGARKGVGCRALARGYRLQLALPPARAMASAARVATPWQGSYRPQTAVAACTGAEVAMFEVTLLELLNMLREAESVIKKEKLVLYIGETKKKRKANKTLKKGKSKERSGKTKVVKKYPGKDKGQCFHYGQDGH
ncbi:hypothetical protein GW17_00029682 [Ensete ventricosum]|nr:hypothetical protein GW17_00029682 [Ensete ventricosum]